MVNKHYVLPSILFKRKNMLRGTITALVIMMLILGVYTLSEYNYGLAIIFGAIGAFIMLFLIIRELIISSR